MVVGRIQYRGDECSGWVFAWMKVQVTFDIVECFFVHDGSVWRKKRVGECAAELFVRRALIPC